MKVYISGKIGEEEISDATYRKFLDAVKVLENEGYEPFNPSETIWVEHLKTSYAREEHIQALLGKQLPDFYAYCLLTDMLALTKMDAICMLPDWESSPGAKAELAFAQAIGLKVLKITNEGQLKE
jgi:hypothetical protein